MHNLQQSNDLLLWAYQIPHQREAAPEVSVLNNSVWRGALPLQMHSRLLRFPSPCEPCQTTIFGALQSMALEVCSKNFKWPLIGKSFPTAVLGSESESRRIRSLVVNYFCRVSSWLQKSQRCTHVKLLMFQENVIRLWIIFWIIYIVKVL